MVFQSVCLKTKWKILISKTSTHIATIWRQNNLQWLCITIPQKHMHLCIMYFSYHINHHKLLGSICRLRPWLLLWCHQVDRKSGKNKPYMSGVVLTVDAMELHKGTLWDQKKKCYIGKVDYGTALPEAGDNLAIEALVFMTGGVTDHWKHPLSYFLQNKISASVQA